MTSVATQGQECIPASHGHSDPIVANGTLTPLRTKAEVQASHETTSVYIVEIPNRSASGLLNVLRDVVPSEVTNSLQHLRRFAKPEFLPRHLRFISSDHHGQSESHGVTEISNDPPFSSREAKSTASYVLVCPTSTISLSALNTLFRDHVELFKPLAPEVREVEVPVFAPTSAIQASLWSEQYWPTVYKNTNPYGPHPSLVTRTQLELLADGDADRYMDLARRVAKDTSSQHFGVEIGVVVVERVDSMKKTRVTTVAGDARFVGVTPHEQPPLSSTWQPNCSGNVMGHAVLRAIAMVAQKRRVLAQLDEPATVRDENKVQHPISPDMEQELGPFASNPLSNLENVYLKATDNLLPNGYLCLDLEIYLTHEPCVMCSMAILHSRFSRVVFEKRMSKTGALFAEENSLGHGLFWRDRLNWRCFVWQWQALDTDSIDTVCNDEIHI